MSLSRPLLGIQLYTVRDVLGTDFEGTLNALAEIGYEGIEGGVYSGDQLEVVKEYLARTGVKYAAGMTMMADFETRLDEILANTEALDCRTVICPWILAEDRADLAGWKQVAARKQKIGEECGKAGFRYLYHIHGYEFEDLGGGTTGFDILMDETDPASVGFELDIYWAFHAGVDPVGLYEKMQERTPYLHLKDMVKDPDPRDVEVGDGIVPVEEIVKMSVGFGCEWGIVEQEMFERPSLEAASISFHNVRRMLEA
ncbi:MAG: sugar phosphate isomerase/epimerase [Fimbriimonadaceae bacterium]|nr:sugar phosphate isomerase/epimerase [Fimbriimonadaceae bacterium]